MMNLYNLLCIYLERHSSSESDGFIHEKELRGVERYVRGIKNISLKSNWLILFEKVVV